MKRTLTVANSIVALCIAITIVALYMGNIIAGPLAKLLVIIAVAVIAIFVMKGFISRMAQL